MLIFPVLPVQVVSSEEKSVVETSQSSGPLRRPASDGKETEPLHVPSLIKNDSAPGCDDHSSQE